MSGQTLPPFVPGHRDISPVSGVDWGVPQDLRPQQEVSAGTNHVVQSGTKMERLGNRSGWETVPGRTPPCVVTPSTTRGPSLVETDPDPRPDTWSFKYTPLLRAE